MAVQRHSRSSKLTPIDKFGTYHRLGGDNVQEILGAIGKVGARTNLTASFFVSVRFPINDFSSNLSYIVTFVTEVKSGYLNL